jgi:hypothetical protein
VIATIVVFAITWLLHAYQWFWLRGEILLTWPDALFWAILGTFVTLNLLLEGRTPSRAPSKMRKILLEPAKIAGTFCVIVTMWSLWNATSLPEWFDLITWRQVG